MVSSDNAANWLGVRTRRYLTYVLLACACASLTGYAVFLRRSTMWIEGDKRLPVTEFVNGATVTHAFLMDDERLHALSVLIAADQPSTLRVSCKVLRLYDRDPGAEDDPNAYTEIYKWTATMRVATGDHWQRFEFPRLGASAEQWYAFEIRLIDAVPDGAGSTAQNARPSVSILASEDNPLRGGKLWIDRVRQPGALFIRAEGTTLYEWFRLHVEPDLPAVLRHQAVQAALFALYLLALVALINAIVFAGSEDASPRTVPADVLKGAARVAMLTAALGLFFLVSDSPATALPLFPELLFLAVLSLICAISLPRSEVQPEPGWSADRLTKFCLVLLAISFGYTVFRAIQSGLGLDLAFDPCAYAAPSAIVRMECRLQASFSQNYAWRSVSHLGVMLCIGVVSAFMSSAIRGFWRSALMAIFLVGVLHAAIGFAAYFSHTAQILPTWVMLNPTGFGRFTYLMPNQSWVWPQLAPALAIGIWMLNFGPGKGARLFGLLGSLVIGAAIFVTRQRGGLLLVGAMVLLALGATVFRGMQRLPRKKSAYALVRLSVCSLAIAAVLYVPFRNAAYGGRGRFIDLGRLSIWTAAIPAALSAHPLAGFGYARWPQEFRRVSQGTPGGDQVYDTAHDLWVQLLFELGLAGFLSVVLFFVGAFLLAMRNATRLDGGRFLVMCGAVGFLICATFQEVDYIRTVFVTHVFLAGICCGLPFPRAAASFDADSEDRERRSAALLTLGSTRRRRMVFVALGTLSLVAALATRLYFSWGLFEFEGSTAGMQPRARRMAQRSTIPVYGPSPLWVFRIAVLTNEGKVSMTPPAEERITLDLTKNDRGYLPMFARWRWWPRRYEIAFEKGFDAWSREIGGMIFYPPIVATVPLLMTRGADEPQPTNDGLAIPCVDPCLLAFLHRAGKPNRVSVDVEAVSRELDAAGRPIEVTAFASETRMLPVSLDAVRDLAPLGKIVMSPAGRARNGKIDLPPSTAWYRLQIRFGGSAARSASAAEGDDDVRRAEMRVIIAEQPTN